MASATVATSEEHELLSLAEQCVEPKRRIEELRERLAEGKRDLLELGLDPGESIVVGGYRMTGCVRRRYVFSEQVEALQVELKERKAREVESGRARVGSESRYVRITRLRAAE
jgi:hypothetical protein